MFPRLISLEQVWQVWEEVKDLFLVLCTRCHTCSSETVTFISSSTCSSSNEKVTWIPFKACSGHCSCATKGMGRLVWETPGRVLMHHYKAKIFSSLSAVFLPPWSCDELICPTPWLVTPADTEGLQRCPVWSAVIFMRSPHLWNIL